MNKSQKDPNSIERRSLLKGTTALLTLNTTASAAAGPGGTETKAVAQTAPEAAGPEADIGIDFHGAIPPQTAKLLIKALEPYQPMFIEEPVACQMEVRLIAGMAEAYYAAIAPHNPLGPISLAAGLQIAASIPNFLCQEQVSLGEGYIKNPFKVVNGYIPLPTAPGLGIEPDENALADKIGHDWRNQESYDADDGSVVDR